MKTSPAVAQTAEIIYPTVFQRKSKSPERLGQERELVRHFERLEEQCRLFMTMRRRGDFYPADAALQVSYDVRNHTLRLEVDVNDREFKKRMVDVRGKLIRLASSLEHPALIDKIYTYDMEHYLFTRMTEHLDQAGILIYELLSQNRSA